MFLLFSPPSFCAANSYHPCPRRVLLADLCGGAGWGSAAVEDGLWPVCLPGTHPAPIIQTPRAPVWHRPPHCTLLVPSFLPVAPPGTLAFLSASGSHKSANPPALLTASPQRERLNERDIASDGEKQRSPSSHTKRGESVCREDKERKGTKHEKGMSGCQARRSLKFKLMLGEEGIEGKP